VHVYERKLSKRKKNAHKTDATTSALSNLHFEFILMLILPLPSFPSSQCRAAQEYVKFVLDTLMAHPVFEFLHVEPTKYYSSLLFLDEHNYTALQVSACVC